MFTMKIGFRQRRAHKYLREIREMKIFRNRLMCKKRLNLVDFRNRRFLASATSEALGYLKG